MRRSQVLDFDFGVAVIINDLERPRLHILLHGGVIETPADESPVKNRSVRHRTVWARERIGDLLHVEDRVPRIHGSLVLGRLADQSLVLVERDKRRGSKATLLVGDDLDIVSFIRGNAGVCGAWVEQDGEGQPLVRLCKWMLMSMEAF